MLYELHVENFALIRALTLPLGSGMNALTGETGAGKSLIIDAVSLLIGGRGGDSFIRSGAERALVEGVFLPPYSPELRLALGAEADPEDNLILSRELIRGGRSVARLNGRVITVARLKELGRQLISIHGQQEHMLLLETAHQLTLLDSFGGADCLCLRTQVGERFAAWQAADSAAREFRRSSEQRQQRLEELRALLDEIDAVAPRLGEDDELKEESHLLAHGERLYEASNAAHAALAEGAVSRLSEAAALLRQGAELDKNLTALAERLNDLYYEADDAAREIAAYRDHVELDPYRLEAVEARLARLNRLCRKYGGDIAAVLERQGAAQREYAQLSDADASGAELQRELEAAQQAYVETAARLSAARAQAAERLSAAVSDELHSMAMPQAEFSIDLPPVAPGRHGVEEACFMIRPNLGEDLQPVSRIASGGELSRIVLGIKVVLSQLDLVPTLIFDEIDSGMSGRALVAVARRLALVGRHAQAIVVSHAPAMAAAADTQLLIEKHEEDGRTVIAAHQLDEAQRVDDLARMIAGDAAGETTRQQAREMLSELRA